MSSDIVESANSNGNIQKPKNFFGVRHIQFVLLFVAIMVAYGMRSNLSVGIVAMTSNETDSKSDAPTYPEWADKKQLMHSSFFWGYICLQIGAGQLAERFGPKLFLCGAMATTSLFAILIPVFGAQFGYVGVIICRVMQGLSQGFLYPSVHNLLGKWTPLQERAKTASYVYCGGPLGTVISNLVTGSISDSAAGWPSAFYLYGGLGFLWCIVWYAFGSNSPIEHKSISKEEKAYIKANVKMEETSVKNPGKTPWKSILTSMPVWAIFITNCGQNWSFWTLLDEIPTYLNKRLGYDLTHNAFMSSLPYLALWILSLFVSPLADFLIVRKYLSTGASRKLFNSIGLFVPAIAMVSLSFVGEDQRNLAVFLLVLAVGANACIFSGYNVNHIDLSPKYSGTLMGLTNGCSNVMSITAPLAITAIEATGLKEEDGDLWKIVFCLAAGIDVFVGCIFVLFASGETQPWNDS